MSKASSKYSEIGKLFSFKRYFINNADSYHGQYVLREIIKVIDKNSEVTPKMPSVTALAEDADPLPPPPPEVQYEIYATVLEPIQRDTRKQGLDKITKVVPKDINKQVQQMLICGTIIFDISYDREEIPVALEYLKSLNALLEKQAEAAGNVNDDPQAGAGDAGGESKKRYLILISNVMTWGATKPLDPENPDMALIETDFRKRKPHPNYKQHYDVEFEIIAIARKYRALIGALVVCSGVTYGGLEDVLFYWFQKAWEGERLLPIFGRGGNVVPTINVNNLAQIIYNLITNFPKKTYILAVEQNISKQRGIVKPIGKIGGSGLFKCIPPEDAFLIPELEQRVYDLMTLNLNMEPTFIAENMDIEWGSEEGFAANVPALMRQFKAERRLRPFKIVVYGPPIVGKTTLAKQLCETYGLVYVSPETVVQDIIEDMTFRVNHWDTQGETSALGITMGEDDEVLSDDDADDEEATQETVRSTLAMLQSGRPISDEEILGFLRQRLLARDALNRGWVLDGYPTNLAQAQTLFEKGDETDSIVEEDEEEGQEEFEEDQDLYRDVLKKLLPDLVFSLEATDDFICEKAMRQPEGDARLDEELVLKRLSEFRVADAREITPLNFFDEIDIHPMVLQVNDHNDYSMTQIYKNGTIRMGPPCKYAKLIAQNEAKENAKKREIETLRVKEERLRKETEKKMKEEREDKMEYWSELYALLREEEEAALAAAGEPMRNYLIHHIFPTLTPALLEVAKLRPEDPVDFLAEYLFKLNPSGKMLEPGYNLQAEKMLGRIKIMDQQLEQLDIQIEPLLPPEAEVAGDKKHEIKPMSNF